MTKKIIVSFLMVVAVICGINFGIANTTTNTAYAAESDASAFNMASVSPYDLYPTGTEANVPLKIMEGDDEICTIKIDPGLTLVANYSASYSSLRILKNSTVKIIPNESFSIKKIYVQAHNNSNNSTAIAIDAAQGTKINYKDLTDDEKTLLGNPSNSMSVATFEINDEYAVTEETPYVMTTSMQFYLKTIHVVFEKNLKDYTVTYDCTTDKKASPATVKVGDATFLVNYEGAFNNGYPAYGSGSFKITIYPVPGYVINYVIFTSSIDNPLDTAELKFSEGLTATYENGNLKVTGMQPGQTYELFSGGAAKGLLTSITVNYIEHEHTGVYEPGSDETYHFKQCVCLWRVDEEEHTYGEGEEILAPTSQRKGKVKYTCTNSECGYEKEEQVAPNLADTEIVIDKELRYNGETQFLSYTVKYKGTVVGLSNYKAISGKAYGKEPGTYTFTIGPKPDSIFEGSKEVNFTIKKGSVAKPALDTTTFYFDKTVKTYNVEESEHYTVLDSSNQQTNPGNYKVRIALNNPDYCEWEDGTIDELEYDFVINKGNYDISEVVFEDLEATYTGSEFSIVATNIPDGVTVEYENNIGTTVGTYIAVAKFTVEEAYAQYYNPIENLTATLKINRASVNKPTADSTVFTYNGQAQTYALQANSHYTISTVTYTSAGTYPITVELNDKTNYEWADGTIANLEYTFVINRAIVNKPTADSTEFTYNGLEQTYVLATSDLYTISENCTQTNAGTYVITVALKDKNNYQWENENSNDLEYSFVIAKATYDMSEVVFEDKAVVYNGSAFSIEATNLPDGVTVTYENNNKTDAGEYTVIAKFIGNENYNEIEDITATLTINKATYNMSEVVFANKTVVYNGTEFSIEATNLPNGVTVTYENNGKVNAGAYTITAKFTGNANYNEISDMTATLTISKASVNKPAPNETEFVYSGSEQTYAVATSDLYTVSGNVKTLAGSYSVEVALKDKDNYEWADGTIDDLAFSFVINKATYDMSEVVFANKTVVYNGTEFSIEATNLPNGVSVTYENNGQINAGEYTITAKFTGNANYNEISDKTATLTIDKATYDMSEVVFANKTVTYNGLAHSIEATNLPNGVSVEYENNGKVNAGAYTITAKFTGNANYNAISDKIATLTIDKATYDMSAVVFANKTVTYNGLAHSIEATNLPNGVSVEYENNGKTNAGEYTIIAKFTGNANYNEISDKIATLTIDKATYDMSAVVFEDKAVVYNGTAFSIEATNIPDGVTVAYENNGQTVVGSYTVTATFTGSANYNAIRNMTATLTISKASVSKPMLDATEFVYNGSEQTYLVATSELYTVTGNVKTLAGTYSVNVALKDKANYKWADGTIDDLAFSFVINKATYDMRAVVFENKTVAYNGLAHSIEATNLPDGVGVEYENNNKTNAGVYIIIAKFTGDADNYNLIENKSATLIIKKVSFTFDLDNENGAVEDIIITSNDGIDPNKELVIKIVESKKSSEDYKEFIDKNQKVAIAYDVKLLKEGASVQPDGTLKFKVLIPEELKGKDFGIIHIHNGNEKSVLEYQIEDDYVIFESDKLSDFVFVYNMGSMLWLIIVLAIIALLEVGFIVFLLKKKNEDKEVKLVSTFPPFVFGMFLAEWQLVLLIILAVVVVALGVVATIYAIKVFGKKKEDFVDGAEDVAVTEESKSVQPIAESEDDEDGDAVISNRIVKSFSDRLSQSSKEVIEYYNDVKNELHAYKKTKSKISFKHEAFRLGKQTVAKLTIRGKSLYLFLALNPDDYKNSKYKIKDKSSIGNSKDVPMMYKINLPRRVTYAKELIADLMKKFSVEKIG